jgi:hypothetical protein
MSNYDDHLPEDLRDIAARLSAARATPNPLELDELRRRVHGRVERAGRSTQRRGLASVLRMNFVAVLLTSGLVFTGGAGVVLASTQGTGYTTSSKGENASSCQYHNPWSKTYYENTLPTRTVPAGKLTVSMVWNGSKLTVTISFTQNGFSYKYAGGGTVAVSGKSYSGTAPTGTSSLTVTAGGSTFVFPIVY